jgi:hypothetical protein
MIPVGRENRENLMDALRPMSLSTSVIQWRIAERMVPTVQL